MTHKYFPGSKDPENTLRHSPSLRRAIPPALEGPLQISAKENDALPPLILSLNHIIIIIILRITYILEEMPIF